MEKQFYTLLREGDSQRREHHRVPKSAKCGAVSIEKCKKSNPELVFFYTLNVLRTA